MRPRLPKRPYVSPEADRWPPPALNDRAKFIARETLKRALPEYAVGLERKIGTTFDLDDFPSTAAARTAGLPVARIVELLGNNRIGEGFATGFLVAPGLLITNWHVFAEENDAAGCGAQFGFERDDAGLLAPGVVFEIDAKAFFVSDQTLDIAIVGIRTAPAVGSGTLDTFGRTRLIPTQGKILVGHPISVIQHPDGRHKHWGVRENKLVLEPADDDVFLSYTTDTLGGSSGSPAFNHDWELVAVHHSGVPRRVNGKIMTRRNEEWQPGMPDEDIDWVANEGARVSKIHKFLSELRLAEPAQQAKVASLLADSVDPVESAARLRPNDIVRVDSTPQMDGWPMNITVNGTANFYLGGAARPAEGVAPGTPTAVVPVVPVGVEKKLKFDKDYANRPGYQPKFLGKFDVPPPSAPADQALKKNGRVVVLDYHNYSLVMHRERRLAMWTAANVDYSESKRWRSRKEFGSDTWKPDPRIPIEAQIEDLEFYEPAAKFDRGHLVRRDDVAWGETKQEEEYGNSDSFHWTNCTPQHEHFNRDMFQYNGLWGQLENHITSQAGFVKNKLILFAGPVLDPNDEARDFGSGIEVQVPTVFWKIVIAVDDTTVPSTLRTYGFFLDQSDAIAQYGWEGRFRAGKFKEIQVPLREITDRTGVTFHQSLHDADPMANVAEESRARRLTSLNDLKLR